MKVVSTTIARVFRHMSMTEGEQSILLAYFGVGFFGAALALNVVNTLGGNEIMHHTYSAYDYWVIASGVVGAWAGLYMGRSWMGQPGLRGIAFAMIGTVWISFLGGLVGGTLALPLYGTMFGPFTLFVSLFSAPLLAFFWACVLMASHFLMMVWRDERDTIFHADLSKPSETYLY